MAIRNYPRGSEWRKWDLHLHTPSSCDDYEDKSVTNEEIINKLVEVGISAVAITDHHEIDPQRIKKLMELGEAKGITVFPGIEIRTKLVAKENIHLIAIFPENSNLEHLSNEILTRLGIKAAREKGIDEDKIFCEDGEVFKYVKENHGLISIHCGEKTQGIDDVIKNDNAVKESIKEKMVKEIDIFEIGNPNKDIDGYREKVFPDLNRKYPLILCSDNHNIKKYYIDEKPFTWIKADLTFEGLKQIIFEPIDRVKIQNESPCEDRKKIYFENITIDGCVNYILPKITVPLNSELVTVIGGRGSGKSALLETFAFLNEEHLKVDQNKKTKIIEFYRNNEASTDPAPSFIAKTTLIDKDFNKQEFQKKLSERENLELPFLYLGQEQLSGLATNDVKLTKTICELIGINIAELNQQNHIFKAREILAQIKNTKQSINDILNIYKQQGFDERIDFEKWVESYLEKIEAQQKRLTSKETRSALEEINNKTQRKLKLKELIGQITETAKEVKNLTINLSIISLNKKIEGLYPDKKSLTLINSEKQIAEIEEIKTQIISENELLEKEIFDKKGELLKLGIKEDVNTLLQSSQSLQQQINNTNKDLENYKIAKIKLSELIEQRNGILIGIENSLVEIKDQIDKKFVEFCNSRNDSEKQEKELFEKIINGIKIEGDIVFDEEQFCKDALIFFDNRKIKDINDLKEEISGKNTDGTAKHITPESIATWIKQDLSKKPYFNKNGEDGILEYIFTNWPAFMRIKSIVKLNDKPTEVLSIGQRGTLLLKVFLATATAKQVFIIDQPEDNLDNNFIMQELVPLIRKAKLSRQIIMSTHNANLVVNADAEQVIVAQLDNECNREYISGSIENPIINQNVKDILEGGEEAFRNRENKYGIKINN